MQAEKGRDVSTQEAQTTGVDSSDIPEGPAENEREGWLPAFAVVMLQQARQPRVISAIAVILSLALLLAIILRMRD
jgi:hypothetical protein